MSRHNRARSAGIAETSSSVKNETVERLARWLELPLRHELRAADMPLMDAAAVQASLEAKLSHTGSSRPVLQFNQFPDELLVTIYNQV